MFEILCRTGADTENEIYEHDVALHAPLHSSKHQRERNETTVMKESIICLVTGHLKAQRICTKLHFKHSF